jgi:hypothetical protein
MTRIDAPTYVKAADPYAAVRCLCDHIVYDDDQPGDSCRWAHVGAGCTCTDHKVEAPVQSADGAA